MEHDRELRKLYKRTFSKITLPETKREEILSMTETGKTRKPIGRKLLVTAIVTALAAALAMGANAASGGELGEKVWECIGVFDVEENGSIRLYQSKGGEDNAFIATDEDVELSADGRTVAATSEDGEEKEVTLYATYSVEIDEDGKVNLVDYQKAGDEATTAPDGTAAEIEAEAATSVETDGEAKE